MVKKTKDKSVPKKQRGKTMWKNIGLGAAIGSALGFVVGSGLYYLGTAVDTLTGTANGGTAGFIIGFGAMLAVGLATGFTKALETE